MSGLEKILQVTKAYSERVWNWDEVSQSQERLFSSSRSVRNDSSNEL